MKKIDVGMKIDPKSGVTFFGLEQANAALQEGASLISIKEGAVISSKVGEDANNVQLAVTGFSVTLVLDDSGQKLKPWWRFW